MLALSGLGVLRGGLWLLGASPVSAIFSPLYVQVSRFLAVFGGGSSAEGMVAIALTVSVVFSLLFSLVAYKRSQRSTWRLALTHSTVAKD